MCLSVFSAVAGPPTSWQHVYRIDFENITNSLNLENFKLILEEMDFFKNLSLILRFNVQNCESCFKEFDHRFEHSKY